MKKFCAGLLIVLTILFVCCCACPMLLSLMGVDFKEIRTMLLGFMEADFKDIHRMITASFLLLADAGKDIVEILNILGIPIGEGTPIP